MAYSGTETLTTTDIREFPDNGELPIVFVGSIEVDYPTTETPIPVVIGNPVTTTPSLNGGGINIAVDLQLILESSVAEENPNPVPAVLSAPEDKWVPATLRLNGPKADVNVVPFVSAVENEVRSPYENLRVHESHSFKPGSLSAPRRVREILDLLEGKHPDLVQDIRGNILELGGLGPEIIDKFLQRLVGRELGVNREFVRPSRVTFLEISDLEEDIANEREQDLILIIQYDVVYHQTDPVCSIILNKFPSERAKGLVTEINSVSRIIHKKIEGLIDNRGIHGINPGEGFRIILDELMRAGLSRIEFVRRLFLPEREESPFLRFLRKTFGGDI